MIEYQLALACAGTADDVAGLVHDPLGQDALRGGSLQAWVRPVAETRFADFWLEVLGVSPAVEVAWAVDNMAGEVEYEAAKREVAVTSARLAHVLDAEACLMFQREVVLMRRTNGVLHLFDGFGMWRDQLVLQTLVGPVQTSSSREVF